MSEGEANEFQEGGALPASLRAFSPQVGLVLGSGLGAFTERVTVEDSIPYGEVSRIPSPGVTGHAGRFVLGRIGETRVVIAQGRVHLYEGWKAREVTAAVRALAAMGISQVILTNAAGSVNEAFAPGHWMLVSDHLNLTGASPLTGGPRFLDMSEVYSAPWRARFRGVAGQSGMVMFEGVYAGLPGPQYETPAEVRMLRTLGADAVGMSTVLEAIQARALGLEVAAFSCLTNWAAGLGEEGKALNHDEVIEVGARAAKDLAGLLEETLALHG